MYCELVHIQYANTPFLQRCGSPCGLSGRPSGVFRDESFSETGTAPLSRLGIAHSGRVACTAGVNHVADSRSMRPNLRAPS